MPVVSVYESVNDPQQMAVYSAQSEVARSFPGDALHDLAGVRKYVSSVTEAEGVAVDGCFRAGWFGDPPLGVLVVWSGRDVSPAGIDHPLADDSVVRVYDPADRWSAFDIEKNSILVAGPPHLPLSHRLLIVHEVAHVVRPTQEMHGAEFVGTFLRLTDKYLPRAADPLCEALARHRVTWATEGR
jgi:hypothetical protein